MRQLTSLDAQFLGVETPRTYGHVGGLAVYDPSTAPGGSITAQDLCRMVSERLHLLPPFRWRLVDVPFSLDLPYWIEDPDFDLDFHIRETAVPPPGGDHQLGEQIARIFARPLDRSRPLWELYLIHGLPEGRVAMLTKVHHAAVDGVSGAEILSILLDPSPEGREMPPAERKRFGERKPSQLEMLGRGALGVPRQPIRALRALPTTVPNLAGIPGIQTVPGMGAVARATAGVKRVLGDRSAQALLEAPLGNVPRTRFNARISPHRRFSFGSLSLDRVKAIKNELGVTVNDVVVTLCTTAVRNWLLERDELPEEPLVAMVPVSVRTEEQVGTFGNRVSAMIVPIPSNEPDPRKRLMKAHDTLKGAKERHKAVPADLLQDATRFIPPAVMSLAARTVMQLGATGPFRPPLNLVISNVPGPRIPLYCAGAQLQANFPVSVVVDGVGLNITCLSYRDHIDFGIVVDREMAPDAWPFMDAVHDALAEIDEEICGLRPEPARPRSREGEQTEAAPAPAK